MLLHNNHWEIRRHQSEDHSGEGHSGEFWLIPPMSVDLAQTPTLLTSKSPLIQRIRRQHAG